MNRALALTLCLVLGGCVGTGYVPMRPTAPGAEVLLLPFEHRDPDQVYGSGQIASGALMGSAGGALTGAGAGAVTGLSCGPWAAFCVPVGLIVGASVGLVAGAVVGGVHSGVTSLPDEKAKALNALLAERAFSRTFATSLHNQFLAQVPGRLNVVIAPTPSVATASSPAQATPAPPAGGNEDGPLRIRVELAQLAFEQHASDELTLVVSTSLQAMYGPGELTKRFVFTRRGSRRGVDHWLGNGGANLDAAVDAAFATSTAQMVRLLLEPI